MASQFTQPRDYLPDRLFKSRSKKTAKLRVTGLCEGNSPVIFHLMTSSCKTLYMQKKESTEPTRRALLRYKHYNSQVIYNCPSVNYFMTRIRGKETNNQNHKNIIQENAVNWIYSADHLSGVNGLNSISAMSSCINIHHSCHLIPITRVSFTQYRHFMCLSYVK